MSGQTSVQPSDFQGLLPGFEFLSDTLHSFVVGTVATAILDSRVVQRKENLRNFSAQIDVGGSAGSTVIKLMHQRGVAAATEVAALTLPNDGTDPDTRAYMAVNFECEPGDRVYHEVTTAPTNGTGLSVSSDAMRRFEGTTQLPVSS